MTTKNDDTNKQNNEDNEAVEFNMDIEGIMENDEAKTPQNAPRRVTFQQDTVDQYKGPGHRESRGLRTSYNDPNTAWFSPPRTKTVTHSTLVDTPSESLTGREIDIDRENREDKINLTSENDEESRANLDNFSETSTDELSVLVISRLNLDWSTQELLHDDLDNKCLEFAMMGNSKPDYDKVNPNTYADIFENPLTYKQAWDHPCSW